VRYGFKKNRQSTNVITQLTQWRSNLSEANSRPSASHEIPSHLQNRQFITMFTTAHRWLECWDGLKSKPSQPIQNRSILQYTHPDLGFSSSRPFGLPRKMLRSFPFFLCVLTYTADIIRSIICRTLQATRKLTYTDARNAQENCIFYPTSCTFLLIVGVKGYRCALLHSVTLGRTPMEIVSVCRRDL
jgi:hypothetical protein